MMKEYPAQKIICHYITIEPNFHAAAAPVDTFKCLCKKTMKIGLIIISAATAAAITFLSRWMALQAVAEVRNAFLRVLIGNFRLVMAGVAGPCPQRGLVTIRTGIPSAAVIHREGVRAVVWSRPPCGGSMAL